MASITIPNQINKFQTLEQDFGTTICPALWLKAAQLAEYVNESYPIGMILFFQGNQAGLPAQPDSRFWKFLDGSPVSNVNSSLNGVTLPDFRGKFFRHPTTGELFPNLAGSDTVPFTHTHGGFTAFGTDWDSQRLHDGHANGQAIGSHRHQIFGAINATTFTSMTSVTAIPAYHEVQCYVRIA